MFFHKTNVTVHSRINVSVAVLTWKLMMKIIALVLLYYINTFFIVIIVIIHYHHHHHCHLHQEPYVPCRTRYEIQTVGTIEAGGHTDC